MTLYEVSSLYEKLASQATRKSDIKLFARYEKIMNNLQQRAFTSEQLQQIEDKLTAMKLQEGGSKASFHRKKLSEFTNFLKKEFSLVTTGYHTNLGLVLGMTLGTGMGLGLGTAFGPKGISLGLPIGTGFGMAIGVAFGTMKDAQAKKEGLVIDV